MINIIIYSYLFSLLFRYVLILELLKLNKNKQNFDCFSIELYEKINKFKVSFSNLIHFIRSKSSFFARKKQKIERKGGWKRMRKNDAPVQFRSLAISQGRNL